MYIVFEGIVGTGKTTQSKRLFEYLKDRCLDKKIIWTREPGGTKISDAIRTIVQGTAFEENMEPICEICLYAASRAQSLRTVVKPVLDEGG
ncbi:MAG: Thymidylate kinase [Parcubacteria group bacterium GW2011_GWB1_46_8]|nr:MAG: Thymidylate kinase [Parcubacteria group bacterium GW2011_GWF1_45_5]KKU11253.1 MAG: Thymidylate kinase [Parcubacteria group bacterium GW2011_GWA1_45_7]KKU46405.1 MAG: Thymidylate kinase [Parcubacteria group bacterium GW2011_GWB1_46_8]KKU47508.1 MAG: Thymidylate kinase [Parcubacteria group bacterium GW2011_GWF2_46_8]